jgi:site-specific recombinase XerD
MIDNRPTLESSLDTFRSVLQDLVRSPRTIQTYCAVVDRLVDYCHAKDLSTALADIDITVLRGFREERARSLLATSMAVEHRSMQAFWKWACSEEILAHAGPNNGPLVNPMRGLGLPRVISQPRDQVTAEQHAAMLRIVGLEDTAHIRGSDAFTKWRDTAILELFWDTGTRLAELADLELRHLDMKTRRIEVTGKGGRRRAIGFGTKAHLALTRYLSYRSHHRHHELPWLWVGPRGRFTRWGIGALVTDTAREAGLDLSPHNYRHGWAARMLAGGMSEGNTMVLGGWTTTDMIHKVYARQTAEERALEAQKQLLDRRD